MGHISRAFKDMDLFDNFFGDVYYLSWKIGDSTIDDLTFMSSCSLPQATILLIILRYVDENFLLAMYRRALIDAEPRLL